ncbi:MAG: hypothetical protein CMI15_09535 [Opitutaceae bacterium]|nr:hypothetical protein [Opitutaceae bacterium]
MDRYLQNAAPQSLSPIRAGIAFCVATWILGLANTSSYGVNPNEIREDTDSEQSEQIDWPEREFPNPESIIGGFNEGERFQFRGQWGILRKVGQITIATEPAENGGPGMLLVKTEARTVGFIKALFPLLLKGSALLDTSKGRILENRVTDDGRSNERDANTRFDFDSGLMLHVDNLRPDRSKERPLPYGTPLDYASAILQIRGWQLEPDREYPLFIASNGKFYLIEMKTTGIDSLNTSFGKIDAYRIEPISAFPQSRIFREGGKMAIWISKDHRRIPLRLDLKTSIGTASMRLESFDLNSDSVVALSE